ncbi:Arc family DNA-binding protein [Rhizobium sp. Leaf453]|uniref:Arc family DNA-binding protein n=1 Tax=Rhizobium sp. Leaf453 TaxID=1736380 RepID=UPI000AA2DA72|nr:Arc family DNA-binding protein [Rhizobium sp. Leaf453]
MNEEKFGKPVAVRLPAKLRDSIRVRATNNRRSMNSEIIVCLEKAVANSEEGASVVESA